MIIWDFDGTLAFRDGMWTQALLHVLQESGLKYASAVTAEHIRPHLKTGFRWHAAHVQYPLRSADEWWSDMLPTFERVYQAVGVPEDRSRSFAQMVRSVYVDPSYWRVYDDTLPTLSTLSAKGWIHLILSNHAPELSHLIEQLGLGEYIAHVFNSADTGYEKPHPMAFRGVLDFIAAAGGAESVWMVGDSISADVRGAEAVGIPAILVRKVSSDCARSRSGLREVIEIVENTANRML